MSTVLVFPFECSGVDCLVKVASEGISWYDASPPVPQLYEEGIEDSPATWLTSFLIRLSLPNSLIVDVVND